MSRQRKYRYINKKLKVICYIGSAAGLWKKWFESFNMKADSGPFLEINERGICHTLPIHTYLQDLCLT